MSMAPAVPALPATPRHRLSTRVWHWVNAVTFFVMLMSGLMIFNAHPRLYWGEFGANQDPSWLQIGAVEGRGYLRVGGTSIDTTGVLGARTVGESTVTTAFPGWATLPSTYDLALARAWHLTFAWVFALGFLAFAVASLANRHLVRDLMPRPAEVAPASLWRDVRRHLRLDFAHDGYNPLQKLAYFGVLAVLVPGMILSGLTMSPAMDAAWPWLLDLFGGRQSARSIHFIFASLLVAFLVVHLVMVLLAGPIRSIGAMLTGGRR